MRGSTIGPKPAGEEGAYRPLSMQVFGNSELDLTGWEC